MATLLSTIRGRIRVMVNDDDSRRTSFGVVKIDEAICRNFMTIAGKLPGVHAEVASAFTIAAGGDTFALPTTTTAQYKGEVRIRLRNYGIFPQKRTVDELDAIRYGNPSAVLGIPSIFALWEEADQTLQGRVWPGCRIAEACDLFKSVVPADLRDTDLDTVTVSLSRIGETALELKTASELLLGLSDDALKLRDINPNVVKKWATEADELLYKEEARIHDLETAGYTQRRVP